MRYRAHLVISLCTVLAGCWDFIEPEFAEENAAAVLQVNTLLDDDGNIQVNALLVPGLDADGFVREVIRDTLYVAGRPITSSTVSRNGARAYEMAAALGAQALTQPFTIDPPRLEGLPLVPSVRWFTPHTSDPDTIRVARGADLLLHVAFDTAAPSPRPVHQWFLDMFGRETRFQIGANGAIPSELRIPASWIPEPADSVVQVRFTSFQAAQPVVGDYRGAYSLNVQIDWTVVIQ